MSAKVFSGGAWKKAVLYFKSGSTWKVPDSAWSNVGGVWKSWFMQGGVNDKSFNPDDNFSAFDGYANAIIKQSTGKIIFAGNFISYNGVTVNRIIRLNSDRTVDSSFTINTGTGFNGNIRGAVLQSDDKIIFWGAFTTFNGVSAPRMLRLNSDGTLDTTFSSNIGTNIPSDSSFTSISVQPSGKILIGGAWTSFNGNASVKYLTRLNSNGTLDTSFNTALGTGPDNALTYVKTQPDGKILIVGNFLNFNGIAATRVTRLNEDGTLDTVFNTNLGTGLDSQPWLILVKPNSKIVIGGLFNTCNGIASKGLCQILSDGTPDITFNTNVGSSGIIYFSPAFGDVQADNKIVLTGNVGSYKGYAVGYIARVNDDGNADSVFNNNITYVGFNQQPSSVLVESDGMMLVSGNFSTFNGASAPYFARLSSAGTLTSDFPVSVIKGLNGGAFIAQQSDGKLVLAGSFTKYNNVSAIRLARINLDGTLDTQFNTNLGFGINWNLENPQAYVNCLAIQPDGKILVGGYFGRNNITVSNSFTRVNADGTADTAFITNLGSINSQVTSTAIQADGKILVGGWFTTFNGSNIKYFARINSDGTKDTSFNTNLGSGPNSTVYSVVYQPDGKILVAGQFTTFNGFTNKYLMRFNSDGTTDTAFNNNVNSLFSSYINQIVLQPDGKIVAVGNFTKGVKRLNADGTLDSAFNTNIGTGTSYTYSVALQSDGKILLGISSGTFNGVSSPGLVRLSPAGVPDSMFRQKLGAGFSSSVTSMLEQIDGKIIVSGGFIAFNNNPRNHLARIGGEDSFA